MHGAVTIARDLIAIPSVNPMGTSAVGDIYSEKHVAAYVQRYCSNLGFDTKLVGNDKQHPNILVLADLGCSQTVLLEAHMDTVSHENMTISPFDPVVKQGYLYGRGSCDTKASLAVYLHAASVITTQRLRLKRNFIIAGVHDEEYSFSGSRELARQGIAASFAIAGEPTSLNIIFAHKGVCRFHLQTEGTSAHAALPWLGDNAIYRMADVIHEIQTHSEELKGRTHPELGHATINVGRIFGGEAVNTVPPSCTIDIDRRLLPGEDYASVRSLLQGRLAKLGKHVKILDPYVEAPGVYHRKDSLPCRSLIEASKTVNWTPEFQTAHFGTDASILSAAGIPTAVFGPGSITLAHTNAECVPVVELEKASDIIVALLTE